MKILQIVRFKYLAALAVVAGATMSLWATTWPGFDTVSTGCYNYGFVTWICINESGTGSQRVPETIVWENLNINCIPTMGGPQGTPGVTQDLTCTATVSFEVWLCPEEGPLFDAGYQTEAGRNIPNGREVTWCQDPG